MLLKVGKRIGPSSAALEPIASPDAGAAVGWATPARLGQYVVGPMLGQGGMGRVHSAYDLVLKREVALKLLWRTDPGLLERFLQEARLQARLQHPNICKIFEVESGGQTPFIAMQLVRGKGLLELELELELGVILDLLIQCARTVHVAHAAGMIHRDLKPGNILLEPDGHGRLQPMLLDFGLAKDLEGPGITIGSRFLGTPAYMAPEQAMGQPASVASDVYALGATFYAFLAGHDPFQADSAAELLLKQSREEPAPLRSCNPGAPSGLGAILRTCMDRDPGRRYPSAQALAEDLQRLKAGQSLRANRALPSQRLLAGAAALALAVLLPLGILLAQPAVPPMTELRGSPSHPVRALLIHQAEVPARAWMSWGLNAAALHTLANRSSILPILPGAAELARSGPLGPASLLALARKYGADLVILTTVGERRGLPQVSVATLRPGDGKLRPILERSFAPDQYLTVEADLRRSLPATLGVSDPGGFWHAPQRLQTSQAFLEVQMLLAGTPRPEAGEAALATLRRIIAEEPGFPAPHATLAELLNGKALEEAHHGRPLESDRDRGEARLQAEQAVQLAPYDPAGYHQLSTALRLAGDLEGAERAALQALKLAPLDIASHWLLAMVENQRPGSEAFQTSLDHMHAAIALLPQEPLAHYRLAQLHLDVGQFAQAVAAEDQAIALQPELEAAHVIRSNALIWSGRWAEGATGLETALRQHPQSPLLQRNLAYTAFLGRNRAVLAARLEQCRPQWAAGSPARTFLEGLPEALDGHWSLVRARYAAALKELRGNLKSLHYTARTSASVDLYLMARVLAEGPERKAAIPFIELADTLYPKRLRMAQRDPAFKGLWPAPEPWPGD